MKSVKRLEIIVERSEQSMVLDLLASLGVDGWSVLPVRSGHGQRGERGLEGLPGAAENDLILAAVDAALLDPLLSELRPILERWGGVCLVTDALWLKHGHD